MTYNLDLSNTTPLEFRKEHLAQPILWCTTGESAEYNYYVFPPDLKALKKPGYLCTLLNCKLLTELGLCVRKSPCSHLDVKYLCVLGGVSVGFGGDGGWWFWGVLFVWFLNQHLQTFKSNPTSTEVNKLP